jgi:hypothetical protein
MQYDIASKIVIEKGKEVILRRFLGMDTKEVELIEELPQEIVSLRRSDFPLLVTLKDGKKIIVLIEIQTDFDLDFVLRFIEYTVHYKRKYGLEVIPFVMLFTSSRLATGFYEDNVLTFKYQVLKLAELDSRDFRNEIWLYPFLPLMRDGEKLLLEAEKAIYESKKVKVRDKADLLTAMAIFTGFKDKNLALELIKRRRDLMRRSPTYDIFAEEIEKEKKDEWMREGLQQGMQQAMHKFLLDTLELRFERIPEEMAKSINNITDDEILRSLHRHSIKCNSLREFKAKMKSIIGK